MARGHTRSLLFGELLLAAGWRRRQEGGLLSAHHCTTIPREAVELGEMSYRAHHQEALMINEVPDFAA